MLKIYYTDFRQIPYPIILNEETISLFKFGMMDNLNRYPLKNVDDILSYIKEHDISYEDIGYAICVNGSLISLYTYLIAHGKINEIGILIAT